MAAAHRIGVVAHFLLVLASNGSAADSGAGGRQRSTLTAGDGVPGLSAAAVPSPVPFLSAPGGSMQDLQDGAVLHFLTVLYGHANHFPDNLNDGAAVPLKN